MGLIAPRPHLALTGDIDRGSPLDGMKTLERKLDTVYRLYGQPDRFRSVIYENTAHVYTDDMKDRMVEWFTRYLQ